MESVSNRYSVMVFDRNPATSLGIATCLESLPECSVTLAKGRAELTRLCSDSSPEIVILGFDNNLGRGFALIRALLKECPSCHILVYSSRRDFGFVDGCLGAGASGYLWLGEPLSEIQIAIGSLLDVGFYLSNNMSELLQSMASVKLNETDSVVRLLSAAELQVFRLVGLGLAAKEVADRMNLKRKTVDTYRDRIRKKLGLRDSSELAFRAFKLVEYDLI